MTREEALVDAKKIVTDWFHEQWPHSTNLDPHVDCDYKKLTKRIAAHLGEDREQHVCTKCGYVTVDQSVEHVIAQAAAHGEDVRKIQVRMVEVADHLRTARYLLKEHWSGKDEWWVGHEHTWSAQADDEIRKAQALLAEPDGR